MAWEGMTLNIIIKNINNKIRIIVNLESIIFGIADVNSDTDDVRRGRDGKFELSCRYN